MFYERKITYLDYTVKGERRGVGGFIKTERRNEICNITLQINAREIVGSHVVVVTLIGTQEKELCKLELIGGKAVRHFWEVNIANIGGTGISYDEMEGIRVLLPSERAIYGKMKERPKSTEGQVQVRSKEENFVKVVAEQKGEKEIVTEGLYTVRSEEMADQLQTEVKAAEATGVVEVETADAVVAETTDVVAEGDAEEEKKEPVRISHKTLWIQDDKWRQLWEIYPHISPFKDEREYLSIAPNDFVILPGKYFRMANNSFLLHGYHNYRHLVLKKIITHGEEKYYIGVPGNYYDREKQVAVMFGFEGFESLKEPASPGDYGYYMMRIEL